MPISESHSGTETVSTTEHSLTTDTSGPDADTTPGLYQAVLDLNNLASGDVYAFRIYEKVLSASTQRMVMEAIFTGGQSTPVWASPALVLLHGWDMTLLKVTGTDRSIDWSIRRVA